MELRRGGDLDRVRDIYHQQDKLIVKLTGKFFCRLLRKLRNPQKHDAVNDAIHKILDTYTRMYVLGQGVGPQKHGKKTRRRLRKTRAG